LRTYRTLLDKYIWLNIIWPRHFVRNCYGFDDDDDDDDDDDNNNNNNNNNNKGMLKIKF
jgi:hypothetical protein